MGMDGEPLPKKRACSCFDPHLADPNCPTHGYLASGGFRTHYGEAVDLPKVSFADIATLLSDTMNRVPLTILGWERPRIEAMIVRLCQ